MSSYKDQEEKISEKYLKQQFEDMSKMSMSEINAYLLGSKRASEFVNELVEAGDLYAMENMSDDDFLKYMRKKME